MASKQDGNRHLLGCGCFCYLCIIHFADTAQHLLWFLAVKSSVGLVCIVYFLETAVFSLLMPLAAQCVSRCSWKADCFECPAMAACISISRTGLTVRAASKLCPLFPWSFVVCLRTFLTQKLFCIYWLNTGWGSSFQPQSLAGSVAFQTQRWRRQHWPGDSSGWVSTLLLLG